MPERSHVSGATDLRTHGVVRSFLRRVLGWTALALAGVGAVVLLRMSTSRAPGSPPHAVAQAAELGGGRRTPLERIRLRETPPPPLVGSDAQGAARGLVDNLSAKLWGELSQDPLFARYVECESRRGEHESECRGLLGTAIYGVMARAIEPFLAEETNRLRSSWPNDTARMAATLRNTIVATRDPARTMAALSVLQLLRPDDAFPLPQEAYSRLTERSDPEIQKILNGHLVPELPGDALKEEVTKLALNGDFEGKIRLAAVNALAHPEDAPYLARIVQGVEDGDVDPGLLGVSALPRALSRCGSACTSMVEQLATQDSADVRRIAYRTIAALPKDIAGAWRDQFVVASPETAEVTMAQIAAAKTPFQND